MISKDCKRNELLSERRLEITQHLFKFSASTMEQIQRDVFKGCTPTIIYREMRHLEKQGVVNRMYFLRNKRPKGVYILTQKGFTECALQSEEDVKVNKFRPCSLLHDLELVDIAFAFKKFSCVTSYWTENQILADPERLRDENLWQVEGLRPDALVKLETPEEGDFFAVEYEASLKYNHGIKSKLKRYYANEELCGVFFICKSKQIFKAIRAVEKKYYAKVPSKILYMTLEECKKATDVLRFYDRNGEDFQIGK